MPKLIFNELRKNPMNRRSFNQAAIAALLGQGFSNTTHAKAADSPEQFDRFGGWTEKKFEATGFFRVENPNTNALAFWECALTTLSAEHP